MATPRTPQLAPPATERGEVTRRHILEIAAVAFAERGYAGTSLNEVIKGSGVTKGGFYFHFPSKESLALEVLRYKQEQWAGRVMSATMRHPRALDQLHAMSEALIDLNETDPSAKSIARICLELGQDPELAPRLTPQFTTWMNLTASILARAQQEGDVRDDLDPMVAAEAAVACFLGLETISQLLTRGADLRERTTRVTTFLLATLAPRKD